MSVRRSAKESSPGNAIDMGILPDLIGFNLRCAHISVFQHFASAMGSVGISAPQFGTLLLIEANPDISQSAIATALRFDRSTLVQIIDRLEGRGFVVRKVSPLDRRSHALRLTPDGEAMLNQLRGMVSTHEADIASGLTDAERDTLIRLLEKLHSPGSDR